MMAHTKGSFPHFYKTLMGGKEGVRVRCDFSVVLKDVSSYTFLPHHPVHVTYRSQYGKSVTPNLLDVKCAGFIVSQHQGMKS